MAFKKNITKTLKNPNSKLQVLYTSAKGVLSITSLLFFLGYFCIAAGFYAQTLTDFFIPLYLAFLVSYISFLCIATHHFGLQKHIPSLVLWAINVLWILLGILFLYPLI